MIKPTAYPDVNAILSTLLMDVRTTLSSHLIGMYLEGSLANGGFDQSSDIDFVVVSDEKITSEQFAGLYAMHEWIAAGDSPWAIQLEGSYFSQAALRRHDPALTLHPNLERGEGERLKLAEHDESWVTHRHILRKGGIVLAGPPLATLIDPVTPDDLRRGMTPVLHDWAAHFLENPAPLASPGYQSFAVLSLCRVLYTLRQTDVVSKQVAAQWAIESLDKRWSSLIEQALRVRQSGAWEAKTSPIQATLDFIRYVLEQSQPFSAAQEANV
jgi:hypothetical protein